MNYFVFEVLWKRNTDIHVFPLSHLNTHTCSSTCFAKEKFSICDMSCYFQNKSHFFPFFPFFFFFLRYILSQHSDWSPSLVASNQVNIKHTWCFWSPRAKLQIGNALLVTPSTKEILDLQFHSSSLLSHYQAAEMRQQWTSMCLIVSVSDIHY